MRIFYVIYVEDEILKPYLNAIRYIGNPNEKYNVHITVRGPYKIHIQENILGKYNEIIENEVIRIKEVGNFFEGKQNTVFLKCEADRLMEIWNKSDYDFIPHITLYDGKSRNFAKNLIEILNSHLLNFEFKANRLSILNSIKGQTDYRLIMESKINYIKKIINRELTIKEIELMSENERLDIIDKITEHISFIKTKKKLAVSLANINPVIEEISEFDLFILRDEKEKPSLTELFSLNKLVLNVLRTDQSIQRK